MKRLQAFGAGVQSVTLLRMILAGEVEPVDRVVFADTQGEPEHVYRVVERESALCEKAGIPFDVVTSGNILERTDNPFPPLFTLNASGHRGALFRQCTSRYKIDPIQKHIRELWGKADVVEQYMGISTDEITRVKPSAVSYIRLRWPLIEKNLRRKDCEDYLRARGIEAAKSACLMCPFQSAGTWRVIRANERDWRQAVAYDEAIRQAFNSRNGVECFVHSSRKPLHEALSLEVPDMFDDECGGYCGL